ncbi:signal-regulatory protein beta-2-like [Pempheris klunzingeri]|uniref:signal-regulatory protein beta-2-like n=1 Tax=Pempheris klunzingeri TaxID=3127111 RepID=UPI0039812F4D
MVVYFVNVFLLWSLCVAHSSEVSQPVPFQAVELGDSAAIECHIKSEMKRRVWYKFTTGKRLQLVAEIHSFYNRSKFADELHRRYSVKFDEIKNHLRISATTWEDVGTYFCGVMYLNSITFGSGTYLMVKGANMINASVVQQPEVQSVQPGDSVTLNCTVHTGPCAAEHTSVMWLKNSDHTAPQMIYTSGYKNDISQRSESGESSLVYDLLMRNLSSDDAGTYYCVVTLCGQTQFGNGTRINIHNTDDTEQVSPTVVALMLSNIILGIVTLVLLWTLFKRCRKDSAERRSSEVSQTGDAVIYAAVSSAPRSLPSRRETVKYSGDSVVYSDVKYCQ